mmetsp:Transcript_9055/g.18594  ORF Transcript_9055/g.18594 Transcript_9055/m.18594 type:complete len:258 (-) Transcript_9055:120-893(-)
MASAPVVALSHAGPVTRALLAPCRFWRQSENICSAHPDQHLSSTPWTASWRPPSPSSSSAYSPRPGGRPPRHRPYQRLWPPRGSLQAEPPVPGFRRRGVSTHQRTSCRPSTTPRIARAKCCTLQESASAGRRGTACSHPHIAPACPTASTHQRTATAAHACPRIARPALARPGAPLAARTRQRTAHAVHTRPHKAPAAHTRKRNAPPARTHPRTARAARMCRRTARAARPRRCTAWAARCTAAPCLSPSALSPPIGG